MNYGIKTPLPWDVIVLLTTTMVGFGLSIKKVQPYMLINKEQVFLYGTTLSNASRNLGSELTAAKPNMSFFIDLGCMESQTRKVSVESASETIRVKGQFCKNGFDIKELKEISIANATTGYLSTVVFYGKDNTFMTDYISLKKGENVIKINWMDSNYSGTFLATVLSP